jgi:signal transduction histidine kinase
MKKPGYLLLLLLALQIVSLQTKASEIPAFLIDSLKPQFSGLDQFIHITELTSEIDDLETLKRFDQNAQYASLQAFGELDRSKEYLAKIKLQSQIPHLSTWTVFLGFFDRVELYFVRSDGTMIKETAGTGRPQSELTQKNDHPLLVNFSIPAKDSVTVYMRVSAWTFGQPSFVFSLYQPENISALINLDKRNLHQGFFHGFLWIMIIYNIFLFYLNREKTYIYYALYMLTISLYFMTWLGILTRYIVPEYPSVYVYVWLITQTAPIFYIQFVRYFLNLKNLLPTWEKLSKILTRAMIIFVLFKAGYYFIFREFGILSFLTQAIVLLGVVFTIGLVISLYQTRNKLARYFILGSLSLGLGMLINFVMSLGGDYSLNYFYSLEIGILGEIVFFSLGLGYKMKTAEADKRKAQDDLIEQLQENEKIQRQANLFLEQKVSERTQEIVEKNRELSNQNEEILAQRNQVEKQKVEIENQNKELLDLNEEKNHLISIVAHDLRNPLASALSMTDLLRKTAENLDEDETECLKIVNSSLNRMDHMIHKILDIRAAEAKKLNLNPVRTDLNKLTREITESFRERAAKKQIELEFKGEPVHATVDQNYYTQVVENLVSNAIKFSPQKKKVMVKMMNGASAKLEVQDQGPGINAEDKKKLFGKFQKLSARPTGGESSTGLGLSIAKKFVEAMDGKIWCESTPGKGASFFVDFNKVED